MKTMQVKPLKSKGAVTLPAEAGHEDKVVELARRWGADAIRDSDGTSLSKEILALGHEVYSTICLVRAEQEWPRNHKDQIPEKYLMSKPVTAMSQELEIQILDSYHPEKYLVDVKNSPKKYWEVVDRTAGKTVPVSKWSYEPGKGILTVRESIPYHVYTVSFLAYVIWDTTSMYNHTVNKWDRQHVISVDPYHKETWKHLMKYYDSWLAEHPDTDVVRFTTLAYHFSVDYDVNAKDKFWDWVGYQETISIPALMEFKKKYGYMPSPEDFVDQGFYNSASRVPSERYLDWMEFIHGFVVKYGRELVRRANKAGKRTAVFWGDHWIGMEPYSSKFQDMGVDIHIGACEDGVALRRVGDAPGPQEKEIRLYPYFFPDVFREGGDPLGESIGNWIKIRRALLRKNIDRIGYGGYLSLASRFPKFVGHVEELCNEFRAFKEMSGGGESYKYPIKVGVLNSWGKWRSWINSFGREQKFLVKRQDVTMVAGTNLLECLSGLPVEVEFLSFREIIKEGIPCDIDVIVNDGDPETAWSGGKYWSNADVVEKVRGFVADGGGFIGCRGPSAIQYQGSYFQLSDVMGVEKENGQSLQSAPMKFDVEKKHFISSDSTGEIDLGASESFVFITNPETKVLNAKGGHVMLAAGSYGKGRSVYMSGLPYSLENSRLLLRSILWSANKEESASKWLTSNIACDCAFYPNSNMLVIVNNTGETQATEVAGVKGLRFKAKLSPYESQWRKVQWK